MSQCSINNSTCKNFPNTIFTLPVSKIYWYFYILFLNWSSENYWCKIDTCVTWINSLTFFQFIELKTKYQQTLCHSFKFQSLNVNMMWHSVLALCLFDKCMRNKHSNVTTTVTRPHTWPVGETSHGQDTKL